MSYIVKYNFTNDLMFKASLERCPKGAIRLIKEFVSDLKDIDINEEVTFLNKENISGVDISTTIFDVNLQIANNLIELEMQNQKRKYSMANRMLKYIADLINSSYDKEKDYVHKPCYSVWFLGFKMYDDDSCIHEFEFYDKKSNIPLVNDTKVVVQRCFELKVFDKNKYLDNTPDTYWLSDSYFDDETLQWELVLVY